MSRTFLFNVLFWFSNCLLLKKIDHRDTSCFPVQHSFFIIPIDTSYHSPTFHEPISKMYLSKRSLLAALFLSSASFTAASASDVVLLQLQTHDSSVDLSSTYREKLMQLRDAFVNWKDQHSISYGVGVMEIQKMKTWVDNHGE